MQLADRDGLEALGAACRDHDVLLICDEVATGFGRTGTLFASEQCGLRPDLLVLGKGLTGGYLPMSATAASGRVFDAFLGPDLGERTLYHGHSYSGNALAAAVALRHLELLDAWDVLENVRARSDELRGLLDDRIASHPAVAEVRLCGLMGGVELAPPRGRPALGTAGVRGRGRAGRAAASARRRGRAHAAAHHHVARAAPDRAHARRRARRRNRAVMSWQDWADHEAKRVHDAEQWRATARPRPRPRGRRPDRRRRRPQRGVVRVERLPGSHPSSRGRRRRPRRARPVGYRFGLGAADRRLAAGALASWRPRSPSGSTPSAPCSSPPASPRTSA